MGRSLRRRGREGALQVLYQLDRGSDAAWDVEPALEDFFACFDHAEETRTSITGLVRGVASHREAIDASIGRTSKRWQVGRMAVVDRNLLRLATYELLYVRQAPAPVIINEAIEIARRFGTENSPSFVNGILDAIARAGVQEGRS